MTSLIKSNKEPVTLSHEKCEQCNSMCIAIRFQQNFKHWTSGNNYIDKFIQDVQLLGHYYVKNALEWIPYDRFYNIKYITKGGFDKVYRANWIDGYVWYWNKNWKRKDQNMFVILKSLSNPINITSEFMNEV